MLRRGLRAALSENRRRSIEPAPYSAATLDQIVTAYADALKRLRKRWPTLNLEDPRAEEGDALDKKQDAGERLRPPCAPM